MSGRRGRRALLVSALAVAGSAHAAFAQGYTVTAADGRIEARPATATKLDLDSVRKEHASAAVALPFAFRLYGVPAERITVGAHGWLLPGDAKAMEHASHPAASHGQDAKTGAFPFGGDADGVVAPL